MEVLSYQPLEYGIFKRLIDKSLQATVLPVCGEKMVRLLSDLYTPERISGLDTAIGVWNSKGLQAIGGIKPYQPEGYVEPLQEICMLYAQPTDMGRSAAFRVMAILGDEATKNSSQLGITHTLPTTHNLILGIGGHDLGDVSIREGDEIVKVRRIGFTRDEYERSCLDRIRKKMGGYEASLNTSSQENAPFHLN